MGSFGIFCLGCAQNEVDAEKINVLLTSRGWRYANLTKAEAVMILACSVRQSAIDRIWGKLNLWKNRAKEIYIVGCVLPADKRKLARKYPFLKILSTENFIRQIPRLFPVLVGSGIWSACENFENKRARRRQNANHAYVPIQFGCDNFCTYCAVPYTRGREKARPVSQIIKEITTLVARGKTYITLLGQNVNSYGLPRKEKIKNIIALQKLTGDKAVLSQELGKIRGNSAPSFSWLLRQIENIKGLNKLDFLSPNPQDMADNVIDWMACSRKFSRKLNLPLQSGSDRILKKMNRRYTAKQYLALVNKIKKAVPDIQLTTDIIVGFPGETETDFKKTYRLCRQIKFRQIYIAKYSPRPGTAAEKFFKDDVSYEEKKRRWEKMQKLF